MVVSLGPGKFYGSSLPRPRFYSDVKFSDERVDPPLPVTDPLLSWAADAHWSMGGICSKRVRLQGRIEGNVERLRKQMEKAQKERAENLTPVACALDEESEFDGDLSDSPPPTPIVPKKRKSRLALLEEQEEEEDVAKVQVPAEGSKRKWRRLVRKLKDDFDLVADDAVDGDRTPLTDLANVDDSPSSGLRSRSRRSENRKVVEVSKKRSRENASPSPSLASSSSGARTSPRLSKHRSRSWRSEAHKVLKVSKRSRENASPSPVSSSPSGARTSPRLSKLQSR